MIQLWSGNLDSYFAHCTDENRRDRELGALSTVDYAAALGYDESSADEYWDIGTDRDRS